MAYTIEDTWVNINENSRHSRLLINDLHAGYAVSINNSRDRKRVHIWQQKDGSVEPVFSFDLNPLLEAGADESIWRVF
jgi:acyl-ACP thioesterase